MKNISLDISKAACFLKAGAVEAFEPKVNDARHALENGTCPGNDFLGWLHLPTSITKEFIAEVQAAADTLRAGDEGGQKAKTLFTALGITGAFTIFRDWLHKIPAAWMSKKAAAYGSSAGIWFSPMMIGVGFLLGPSLIFIWFLGAVLGDFGILFLGVKGGFLTTPEAVSLNFLIPQS